MQQSPVILNLGQENHMIIVTSSFMKSSVLKMCFVHTKLKHDATEFSNFSGFKSVSEKLQFRGGLVWTVGLTAPFSNFCVLVKIIPPGRAGMN